MVRTRVVGRREFVLRPDHIVVLRQRRDWLFRNHVHDLVAASFELAHQFGHGFRGAMLEVVHQNDALAILASFVIADLTTIARLVQLEIECVDIGRKYRDVARAEISHQFTRLLQIGKAKEWCNRSGSRHVHRAHPHFASCLACSISLA